MLGVSEKTGQRMNSSLSNLEVLDG